MRVLDVYPWVESRFCNVREEHNGEYVSTDCPFKNHKTATLRFHVGDEDGRLCFWCWGGCPKLEILRAVGATWKDCFPGDTDWKHIKQEVVAQYPYRDELGKLLYETVRLEPGRGGRDKDFRQRRPNGVGGWAWKLGDVRRVLYRLPELVAAKPNRVVLVVAGEKDADELGKIGILGTTNVCGERSEWTAEYSKTLAGRDVIVVEDRDAVGCRHANEVVGSLLANGVGSVRRGALPAKDTAAFLNGLRTAWVTSKEDLQRELWEALKVANKWVTT